MGAPHDALLSPHGPRAVGRAGAARARESAARHAGAQHLHPARTGLVLRGRQQRVAGVLVAPQPPERRSRFAGSVSTCNCCSAFNASRRKGVMSSAFIRWPGGAREMSTAASVATGSRSSESMGAPFVVARLVALPSCHDSGRPPLHFRSSDASRRYSSCANRFTRSSMA